MALETTERAPIVHAQAIQEGLCWGLMPGWRGTSPCCCRVNHRGAKGGWDAAYRSQSTPDGPHMWSSHEPCILTAAQQA